MRFNKSLGNNQVRIGHQRIDKAVNAAGQFANADARRTITVVNDNALMTQNLFS